MSWSHECAIDSSSETELPHERRECAVDGSSETQSPGERELEFKRQPVQRIVRRSTPPFTVSPEQQFRYSPLDHQVRSIRLIRLRADKSKDGLYQCDLRHSSIDDRYSCLSYVWGDASSGKWILLDGQKFWIRRNLFDFLAYARRKPKLRAKWLWIDALSIDQTTVAERNHQVQQMGQIYSGAREVIAWLGSDDTIASFLRSASIQKHSLVGFSAFCNSPYWDRAWITQEIALAPRVRFMAKSATLDGNSIPLSNKHICQLRIENLHAQTAHQLRGRSLIYLLDRFRLKKAGNIRDRIFSLLALCGDGSDLEVDYNKSLPELARDILKACKRSLCFCSVTVIGKALDLPHTEQSFFDDEETETPFARIRLPSICPGPDAEFIYGVPCDMPGCDGTDWSHVWNVDNRTAARTRFSVQASLECICSTFRGEVTFLIDADLRVIDSRSKHYERSGWWAPTDSHQMRTELHQNLREIRIPSHLLLRAVSWFQFGDRCCRRVADEGTRMGPGEGSEKRALLKMDNILSVI